MASLKVSYSVINEAIMQLHNISSKPEEIYVAIGRLKSNFSISNSASAKELINAMDTYKEIYGLILGICNNAADMLQVAKYLYSDMDDSMSEQMN